MMFDLELVAENSRLKARVAELEEYAIKLRHALMEEAQVADLMAADGPAWPSRIIDLIEEVDIYEY